MEDPFLNIIARERQSSETDV